MMSAKISLVIRRLAQRGGGAERVYIELANMLGAEGHRVRCLHFDRSRQAPAFPLDSGIQRKNLWSQGPLGFGAQELLAGAFYPYRKGALLSPAAWLAEHGNFTKALIRDFRASDPDLVISFMPAANTPSLLASAWTGHKVVACNHNHPEQDYASQARWDQNPLDRSIRLPALRLAHRIHVLFESYGKWFPADLQRKVEVVHNYPTDDVFQVGKRLAREKLVVAAGRLAKVKNYGLLIDAWAKLAGDFSQWRLEIFGQGPDERQLQSRIERLGVGDRVILGGQSERMADVYDRASLFAHPSSYEGFPLSVTEALARGVPVVGFSDTSGVDQLVLHEKNGLLLSRQGGAEEFSNGLRALMQDESKRAQLAAAGPSSVSHYTKERNLLCWQRIIAEALGDG